MNTMDELIRIEIDPADVAQADVSQAVTIRAAPLDPGQSVQGGPICRLPFNRSPHFTGREKTLEELHRSFQRKDGASRTQALVGLAGVGKTQIALEHAHRNRDEYSLIWWLRADDETALAVDYAALARELF